MSADEEKTAIARKIKEAYPWLDDAKVNYFTQLAIKNKYGNN